MPDPISLESLLRKRTEHSECRDCSLLANYVAMKNYLTQSYYPWIQANCPWFTDHGEKHVDSVIHTAEHMLSAAVGEELGCLDLYLLLTSIIWHDVGMVAGRANHASHTKDFISKVQEICFPDPALYRLVSQITRAHAGRDGWSFLRPSEPITSCAHRTSTVYPQSLAALLRLADEVSETRMRISPALLHNVPPEQRIYWEYAHAITASKPEPVRRRLLLAVELQRSDAVQQFACPAEFCSRANGDGRISLIEYVVCRIEKINNERAYCFPYLTRYADIRTVEVHLQVCEGTESKTFDDIVLGDGGLSNSGYPEIGVFDHFFDSYPQLKPVTLEGGL